MPVVYKHGCSGGWLGLEGSVSLLGVCFVGEASGCGALWFPRCVPLLMFLVSLMSDEAQTFSIVRCICYFFTSGHCCNSNRIATFQLQIHALDNRP